MKEFPIIVNVKNKNSFSDYAYERTICYLRRDIYDHILNHTENEFFDLDKFNRQYDTNMINLIIKELSEHGWKCKVSFGGTALFIYSTDKPPISCWDDGLE
jgi:hypothetical protein